MSANPFAVIARLPRLVRLLVLGTLINKAGGFILPYLTIVLIKEFRLSASQAGLLVTAYGIGSIISILVGGVTTDRLGRRRTLLLSLFGGGSVAVAMAFTSSAAVFVPLLLLFGFLAELYRPASSAIIGDLLPSSERATGFAALRVAVNLGFAIGMAIGGLLVGWSWRVLFAADGLTTAAFGLIVLVSITETRPKEAHVVAGAPVWRDTVFLRVLLSSLAFGTVLFSFMTIFPLTVTQWAGYPPIVYGLLVGMNGLLVAAFEVSAVVALKRFRRLRVASFGILLSGLGFGAIGFIPHWLPFLITGVVWTAGEILTIPQQMSFIADWAPPESRGRYLGAYGATWSLGLAINSVVLLPLHARLPESQFWPLLFVLITPAFFLLRGLDATADRPELLRGRSEELPLEAATVGPSGVDA
jgi:MFS family permease